MLTLKRYHVREVGEGARAYFETRLHCHERAAGMMPRVFRIVQDDVGRNETEYVGDSRDIVLNAIAAGTYGPPDDTVILPATEETVSVEPARPDPESIFNHEPVLDPNAPRPSCDGKDFDNEEPRVFYKLISAHSNTTTFFDDFASEREAIQYAKRDLPGQRLYLLKAVALLKVNPPESHVELHRLCCP